ncbi:Transamidase GatB domain protein [hydrothermal vent metagenome]|uniref:Transamidase GatB domain protein n=1 Tax=hydrothermal vent metagenome TaxID=652676 RepID=A0A3B0ZYL5_9ZZZZ
MSDLKQRINDNVKDAMRAKEKVRLKTLRLITSAIKQIEVDKRIELDDDAIVAVLEKMLKQRKDSIEAFEKADRTELVDIEKAEVLIIKEYMPEQMPDAEIDVLIDDAIAATSATTMKDMGKVMGMLKAKLAGKADMGAVSGKIKAKLS